MFLLVPYNLINIKAPDHPADILTRLGEVGPAEVGPAEVGPCEVRGYYGVSPAPLVPGFHPFFQYVELLLVGHRFDLLIPYQMDSKIGIPALLWPTSPMVLRNGAVTQARCR